MEKGNYEEMEGCTAKMLIERFRAIVRELNEIRFVGLTDYDMGSSITVQVKDLLQSYPESIKTIFKRLIVSVFFKQYTYNHEIQPGAKILFLFSQSYAERGDHKKTFNKVTSLLKSKDTLIAEVRHKMFDIRGSLLLIYLPIWLMQMRKVDINFKYKLYLASSIVESKKWVSSMEFKISPQKYNLLVTFCDAHLADNLLTQRFKKAGVATATLQHGWYNKTLKDAEDFSKIGLGFEGFLSDNILIWGDYIKTNAIQSGVVLKSLICAGHPRYIGYTDVIKGGKDNMFGIILGRSMHYYKQENIKLIEIANSVSEELGVRYVVKFHPGDTAAEIREYDDLIKPECLYKTYQNAASLGTYIMDVELSIVGTSSVYADLLYMGEIVFRFTAVNDDYDEIQWGKFNNKYELLNLMKAYQKEKDSFGKIAKETGCLLCGKGNIADNYKGFFSNFM